MHLNQIKKNLGYRLGYKTVILFFLCLLLFAFNGSYKSVQIINQSQSGFDYSGTNSLFIAYSDGIEYNWITNKADTGFYELRDANNTIILKGETANSRVHSISIDHDLKNNVSFKFGGIHSDIYEVNLRPDPILNKSVYTHVDSLFVVGDIHGRYIKLINLLQKSLIIDADLNWIAGTANLLFLGDIFDRGNDVTKTLWFIYALEEQAKLAGGKVHLVLGNHEIMIMTNDLRYLGRKEASIPIAYKTSYDKMYHPTKSLLGVWLRSKPSVVKIDKAIFAHGGIVDLETNSISLYNKKVHDYMKDPIFLDIMKDHPDSTKYSPQKWLDMHYFFYDETSPFWYRGYTYTDTLDIQLNAMLKKYKSKIHVIAHTPQETITQKYKGKLLTTDLIDGTTQLLLLVRKKNKYEKFKIDSEGSVTVLH